MLEKILLAVDGSDAAASATAAVGALARHENSDVVVVHITDRGEFLRSVYGPDRLTLQWETPHQAQALVDEAVRTLETVGVHARGQVYGRFDTIARELLDVAGSLGCSAIAMGTRGRGRIAASLLGSVAHRVIHLADTPVLVAPPAPIVPGPTFARILVAVDGSAASRRALDLASEVGARSGGHVVVLHVCRPNGAPWQRYVHEGLSVEQETPETAETLVEEMSVALQARGVSASATVVASTGSDAGDIVDAAVRHDIGLIVVGSRGRGSVPALVLGSTTYRLLHTASCPVLVAT